MLFEIYNANPVPWPFALLENFSNNLCLTEESIPVPVSETLTTIMILPPLFLSDATISFLTDTITLPASVNFIALSTRLNRAWSILFESQLIISPTFFWLLSTFLLFLLLLLLLSTL